MRDDYAPYPGALLFFQTFDNESGIPPPATDVFWDLNDAADCCEKGLSNMIVLW